MKQGIIYGGTFLFVFVIITGLLIYLNSSYENIFQFNFARKSAIQLPDSTKTDSLKVVENKEPFPKSDSTTVKDSVLLSTLGEVGTIDTTKVDQTGNLEVKNPEEKVNLKKENEKENTTAQNPKTDLTSNQQPNIEPNNKNVIQGKEYTDWIQKVTSIYSAMEPKKAAKIIQTYSDNVARDILYNMSKKTAAKVVSEFSPETANRIFRFE
jgi:flagellar motility protein MotE (MotC chaperone)